MVADKRESSHKTDYPHTRVKYAIIRVLYGGSGGAPRGTRGSKKQPPGQLAIQDATRRHSLALGNSGKSGGDLDRERACALSGLQRVHQAGRY